MSFDDRPRARRRGGVLRTVVSIVVAAAILLFALAALLGDPPLGDLTQAATRLAVQPPSPVAAATASTPPTPAPTATHAPQADSEPTPFPTSEFFDRQALQQHMLDLINQDRQEAGLDPVAWDEPAAVAAQAHAFEMARDGYLSHWNRAGHGPMYRYTQAGGLDVAYENVYLFWQRYQDGSPVPVDDWHAVVREAQAQLMDSPGHRRNILAPEHTHVGVGIAYNGETGDVTIGQLFVDDYVDLDALPLEVDLGDEIEIRGELGPGASEPLLNVAYEPFPTPMTVEELGETGSFVPDAHTYLSRSLRVDGDEFQRTVPLDYEGQPGLYHVRVWVRTEHGMILASNVVIEVR